jgi:hypothetical protein
MEQSPINLNEIAEGAAYQAIETAIIQYFQVRDCIVNFDTQIACILFDPVVHRKWISRFNGHFDFCDSKDIPISVPLRRLPPQIKQMTRPILERLMAGQESLESYLKWKPLERKIVPGTITEAHHAHYKISLKGETGTLDARDAIKRENYSLGKTHLFHVKRVRMNGDNVRIHLSRRSKRLPEFVLASQFPKYRFKCYRRLPGIKSWIRTTAPRFRWGLFLSKDIRQSLAGEYLQFYS